MFPALGQNIVYALRRLRCSPAFACTVILTLALVIGATTAMFSLAEAVWLRPLPYSHAGRLVNIWLHNARYPHLNAGFGRAGAALVRRAPALGPSAEYVTGPAVWRLAGRRLQTGTALVSRRFFSLLGAAVAAPSGQSAVISRQLAVRLGGPRHAIGKAIRLGGAAFTVASVAPRGFGFPTLLIPGFPAKTNIWLGLSTAHRRLLTSFGSGDTSVLARLRPEATLAQLQAQLAPLDSHLPADTRPSPRWRLIALPLVAETVGHARAPLAILFAATIFLWLIAVVNVAHLLLERGWRRGGEFGLRMALGAGPGAIMALPLTEALLLAIAGGGLGLVLAYGALKAIWLLAPAGWLPVTARTNGPLALFAFGAALFAGVAAGWWPARQSLRRDPQATLRGGGPGIASAGSATARRVLLLAEMALAAVLLVSALVLVRGFARIAGTPVGLRTPNIITSYFFPPRGAIPRSATRLAVYRRLLRRARSIPGATGAALTGAPLLAGMTFFEPPVHAGRAVVTDFHHRAVTSSYFRLLGIPLLRGRDFSAADRHGTPEVAIINRAFAREGWPHGGDPLGRQMVIRWHGQHWTARVIGVVGDARDNRLRVSAPPPEIYTSLLQDLPPTGVGLLLRTRGPAAAHWPYWRRVLRQLIWSVIGPAPISFLRPLSAVVAKNRAGPGFRAAVLAAFAFLGLLLAALGVYGVFAYAAAQRSREFGIRLALGATRRDLTRMVVSDAVRLMAAGLAAGLLAAWFAARAMAHWLYAISPADPAPFLAAAILLAAAGLAAVYLPLRRALRLDPARTLREP